jgi:hypothetical protein
MPHRALAALTFTGLLASTQGCAGEPRHSVLFASWSAGPYAPMAGHTLLRVDADPGVDVERWSDWDGRWELVCTTPCTESVLAQSTYRLVTPWTSSRPFTLPQEAHGWMFLELGADGNVWTLDSPSLREVRAKRATMAGAGMLLLHR